MYLTVGQLNKLFQHLIDTEWSETFGVAHDVLEIDQEVLEADIPIIQQEKPELFFYKQLQPINYGRYELWIPEKIKPQAIQFLADGGWKAHFDEQHARYQETEKRVAEMAARQREKEDLEMEVQRLQIADWPKMQRERKITRWIAIIAALISLVATVVALIALSK